MHWDLAVPDDASESFTSSEPFSFLVDTLLGESLAENYLQGSACLSKSDLENISNYYGSLVYI